MCLPVEVICVILEFTERSTLKEVRLCSRLMRDAANRFVFDKLRIFVELKAQHRHYIKNFMRLWLGHNETPGTSMVGPSFDPHILTLLMCSHQISDLNIHGCIGQFVQPTTNLHGPSRVRHLAFMNNGAYLFTMGAKMMNDFTILQQVGRYQPEHLVSIHIEMNNFNATQHLFNLTSHDSYSDEHLSHCIICTNPMPVVQQLTMVIPAVMLRPRAWSLSLLAYVALKFPGLQILNVRSYRFWEQPSHAT